MHWSLGGITLGGTQVGCDRRKCTQIVTTLHQAPPWVNLKIVRSICILGFSWSAKFACVLCVFLILKKVFASCAVRTRICDEMRRTVRTAPSLQYYPPRSAATLPFFHLMLWDRARSAMGMMWGAPALTCQETTMYLRQSTNPNRPRSPWWSPN